MRTTCVSSYLRMQLLAHARAGMPRLKQLSSDTGELRWQHICQAAPATPRMVSGGVHVSRVLHDAPQLLGQTDAAGLWAYLARRRSLVLLDKSTAAPPTLKMQPASIVWSNHVQVLHTLPAASWDLKRNRGRLRLQPC